MRVRTVLLFSLALSAAGLTAYVTRNWVQATERQALASREVRVTEVMAGGGAVRSVALSQVLVAATDLPTGTIMRHEHVEWRPWPTDAVDPRYATEDTHQVEGFVGAVARTGIAAGEPIVESRLVRLGDSGFLAAILQPGMRALTVEIDASSGIAGLIMPGDRVDVIVTHEIGRDEDQLTRRASETVLRNVRVLALDQRLDDVSKQAGLAKTATLELEPKQTEVLAMVADLGRLSLSLRALPGDDEREAGPRRNRTFTTDTEVSSLLRPMQRLAAEPTITIVRGKNAEQVPLSRKPEQ